MNSIRIATAAWLLAFAGSAVAESTSVVMRDVYDAIAYLLPLSVRGAENRSPWDKELVNAKLEVLTAASGALVEHAREHDAEFAALARSFDRLVENTADSFREEWPDYAYYSLMELTDHCVACHSRLPAESQALFSQRLLARMDMDEVPPESQALLYVATRQFDLALDVLEKRLMDPAMDPIEAEYRGTMVRYLRIGLSVTNSVERVRAFLERYAAREDLPWFLQRRLAYWQKALTRHAGSLSGTPNLKRAFQVFDHATALSPAPGNRIRAVEDFIAARIMRTYLQSHPDLDPATRAEVYFRLAVIALRTTEPEPGVPEMEILLAAAIEAAPEGPHAKQAYGLLEEYGYVHEEHLARQLESRILIDMAELRAKVGEPSPP